MMFRFERGEWKIIHRHADTMVAWSCRRPDRVVRPPTQFGGLLTGAVDAAGAGDNPRRQLAAEVRVRLGDRGQCPLDRLVHGHPRPLGGIGEGAGASSQPRRPRQLLEVAVELEAGAGHSLEVGAPLGVVELAPAAPRRDAGTPPSPGGPAPDRDRRQRWSRPPARRRRCRRPDVAGDDPGTACRRRGAPPPLARRAARPTPDRRAGT